MHSNGSHTIAEARDELRLASVDSKLGCREGDESTYVRPEVPSCCPLESHSSHHPPAAWACPRSARQKPSLTHEGYTKRGILLAPILDSRKASVRGSLHRLAELLCSSASECCAAPALCMQPNLISARATYLVCSNPEYTITDSLSVALFLQLWPSYRYIAHRFT